MLKPQRIEPQGEDDDGGAEHGARAEAIGDPAADRDEDREAQQIGGDGEVEVDRVVVEALSRWPAARSTITVESRFSMNSAQATISGMIIERGAADADGMRKTKGKSRARRRQIAVTNRATGARTGVG